MSSSTTTTSITLPKHKSKKSDKSSKSKHKRNTTTTIPTPENEFLQFYSELYKSAILFSNRNFQQMLLFPQGIQSQLFGACSRPNNVPQNRNNVTSPNMKKRSVKKAQRRLSGGSAQQQHPSNKPLTSSTSSVADYNSAESGGSLTKKAFADHFTLHPTAAAPVTSTPAQQGGKSLPIKLKRRVSFSKNSPRARSRSNSQQQQYQGEVNNSGGLSKGGGRHEGGGSSNVPWITIQEHCWSSDMDETDTTEEESGEENATSTMGEGDGFVRDADAENSTTDDGMKTVKEISQAEVDVQLKFGQLSTTNKAAEADLNRMEMPESEA